MKRALAIGAAAIFALLWGCASQPRPVEELRSVAVKAADQRGAAEFGCEAVTLHILTQETIQEPQLEGWFDYPHKASYTGWPVTADGRSVRLVHFRKTQNGPPQLADKLQSDAVKAAQQHGATELSCEAVTTAEDTRYVGRQRLIRFTVFVWKERNP